MLTERIERKIFKDITPKGIHYIKPVHYRFARLAQVRSRSTSEKLLIFGLASLSHWIRSWQDSLFVYTTNSAKKLSAGLIRANSTYGVVDRGHCIGTN